MPFKFAPRSKETVTARARDKGKSFDGPIIGDVAQWKPKEGKNRIRIIPWSTDPARLGLGMDLWVHSGVGADNSTYVCLAKMKGEACPICEERASLDDEEAAKELRPYKRVVCWIIDRNAEDEGPQLFLMGAKMESELNELSVDEAGEILQIDHPDEGYDVEFSRAGKGMKTQYSGTKISRRSTPLCESPKRQDKWLTYCLETHPVGDCVQYYDAAYIEKLLNGKADKSEDDDDAPKPRTRAEARKPAEDDDEPAPKPKSRAVDDDDEPAPRRRKPAADEGLDDEDDAPPTRKRPVADDDDEPAPKRKPAADEDDEPAPKPKPRVVDDEPAPRAKPAKPPFEADDDEPAPKPKPKAKSAEDDDDEPAPRRRKPVTDDDE
jgi:hypothetical protein